MFFGPENYYAEFGNLGLAYIALGEVKRSIYYFIWKKGMDGLLSLPTPFSTVMIAFKMIITFLQ